MRTLPLALALSLGLLTALPSFGDPTGKPAVSLQTTSGETFKGTVSGIREGSVSLVTEFGVVRVPLEKLTAESKKALEQASSSSSGETAELRQRVTDLEALVATLRAENAALRRQNVPTPATPQRLVEPGTGATTTRSKTTAGESAGGHWISNTGKRHNSRCRYYQNSQGRNGGPDEGVACKICGG